MFLQPLDLTTALRPELLPDEVLLFVQDAVGLYEGKYKIPSHQNGQAYLTSHRICYVDNAEPRKNSAAIELKTVERYEFYAGFLKSSPKVTVYPKLSKRSSVQLRRPSTLMSATSWIPPPSAYAPSRSSTASPVPRGESPRTPLASASNNTLSSPSTWICPICSFSNPLPTNFEPSTANAHTPVPPCLACGIKPPFTHVLKAAISSTSSRQVPPVRSPTPTQPLLNGQYQCSGETVIDYSGTLGSDNPPSDRGTSFQCPRCTFLNHRSLLSCELCGASLISADIPNAIFLEETRKRAESPGPTLDSGGYRGDIAECIKCSFRGGGEKIFLERLKGAMVQRKWLLQNAPPIPRPVQMNTFSSNSNSLSQGAPSLEDRSRVVGIAGLERRGIEFRKNNELVIGNAFEDLEALMASAKEIVALAESFAGRSGDGSSETMALVSESATALGMVTTKDMLGSNTGSDSLYLSELSRNLAEYLTDDRQGVLKREGGIMSLVDLWAMFNRAREGVELISPMDFEKAARLWDKIGLPVRLREFKNGLLVVQRYDWTDDKTIMQLLAWLQELHRSPPSVDVQWDWAAFGRGVTAQEVAARFGWSVGVANEELEMAEEKGALCREEGVEGLRFWENWIFEQRDSYMPPYQYPDTNLEYGMSKIPEENLRTLGLL